MTMVAGKAVPIKRTTPVVQPGSTAREGVYLFLPPAIVADLDSYCEEHELSRSDAVTRAIENL